MLSKHRQKLWERKLMPSCFKKIHIYTKCIRRVLAGALGNQNTCLCGCNTASARHVFHKLPEVESLQYTFDNLLPEGFSFSTPTLIGLRSFATVLAEARVSLCTAAPKDNKNDNDQLLLEEVFLDQFCWCSSISGFMK